MTTISIRIPQVRTLTTPDTAGSSTVSLWTRIRGWFRSTWCVMNGGHYKLLHTDPDRLALRCVACGHMSPGWEVGAARPARRVQARPEPVRVRRQAAA